MDELSDEEYMPEWVAGMRSRTVSQGMVGDIEWVVAAMAPLPGLNAYLRLPDGHPWTDEDVANAAPVYADFHRFGWHGCCGLDGDGRWETDDLLMHVTPFPVEWFALLDAFAQSGVRWPLPFSAMFDHPWTVDTWVAATVAWAEAADRALSPVSSEREGRDGDRN